jgi:phosphoserine phosphatase
MRRGRWSKSPPRHPVDIAIQAEGLHRRARRLVVLDVDSTLIQNEMIDLLAEEAGVVAEVGASPVGRWRASSISRRRCVTGCGCWPEPRSEEAIERVADRIELTPGARTFVATLRASG